MSLVSDLLSRLLPWSGAFRDKVVMVCGADGELGAAIARSFAAQGAHPVLVGRDAARLRELGKSIEADLDRRDADGEDYGEHRVIVAAVDLADSRATEARIETIVSRCDYIDVLVNVPVAPAAATLEHLGEAELQAALRDQLATVFNPTRAVLPLMAEAGNGAVVNVASAAGLRPVAGWGAYCTAHAALIALTESLRAEAAAGVHIGLVLTAAPAGYEISNSLIATTTVLAAYYRLREVSAPAGAATAQRLAAMLPSPLEALWPAMQVAASASPALEETRAGVAGSASVAEVGAARAAAGGSEVSRAGETADRSKRSGGSRTGKHEPPATREEPTRASAAAGKASAAGKPAERAAGQAAPAGASARPNAAAIASTPGASAPGAAEPAMHAAGAGRPFDGEAELTSNAEAVREAAARAAEISRSFAASPARKKH